MKVVKYIRLSVEDVKSAGMSIENQRLLLDRHIMETGLKDAKILEIIDNGVSGTHYDRPGIQQVLELVRNGGVDVLYIKDFSRLGRTEIETGYIFEMVLPLYNVRLISVSDGFDSAEHEGDTGGLEVAFKFLMNAYYSRDLSKKIASSKREKTRRGEYYQRIPLGYVKVGDMLKIDEPNAKIVREIFRRRLNGQSAGKIAEILETTPAKIQTILADESYTGTYVGGKSERVRLGVTRLKPESEWVKIPNHHPPIISAEMFRSVNANRKKREPRVRPAEFIAPPPIAERIKTLPTPRVKPAARSTKNRELFEQLVLGEIDAAMYKILSMR